jgi:hypothetical protein
LFLLRYYDQLEAMVTKLPITPTQNPISFKWKDAFDKGSLFFSRASLSKQIFNKPYRNKIFILKL